MRGLEILPAGNFVENATELLASAHMGQIAARLGSRSQRRLVIFDTAPLLVSSEARVMLRVPGQVVLVVRAGMTPRHAVIDAAGHIDRAKFRGLILNHAPFTPQGGYYEYSGYGAGDGETSSDA